VLYIPNKSPYFAPDSNGEAFPLPFGVILDILKHYLRPVREGRNVTRRA
jgi:hypothetical protein